MWSGIMKQTSEFDSEVYKNILFVESNKYTILSNKSSV